MPRRPGAKRGERRRWRVIVHFGCCAKVRYVFVELAGGGTMLLTAHPDPEAEVVHVEA